MTKKKVLLVIAPKNFRDEELFQTQEVLRDNGIITLVTSKNEGLIRGVMGGEIQVEKSLGEIQESDYQAVIFIGGPGTSLFFTDPQIIGLAKRFYEQGKIVAAICIAPVILANAGLLEGKKATVWSSPSDQTYIKAIESKGAIFVNQPIVVDSKIITANGPTAASQFAEKILEALKIV